MWVCVSYHMITHYRAYRREYIISFFFFQSQSTECNIHILPNEDSYTQINI